MYVHTSTSQHIAQHGAAALIPTHKRTFIFILQLVSLQQLCIIKRVALVLTNLTA